MNEQEIKDLAEMFDTIVSSTNPAIQRSFQHTMVLATLAEEKKSEFGPFSTMIKDLTWMREQMQEMKRDIQILQNQSSNDHQYDVNVMLNDPYMNMGGGAVGSLTTQQITALTTTTTPYPKIDISSITIGNISVESNYNHNFGSPDFTINDDYITIDKC